MDFPRWTSRSGYALSSVEGSRIAVQELQGFVPCFSAAALPPRSVGRHHKFWRLGPGRPPSFPLPVGASVTGWVCVDPSRLAFGAVGL